MIIRTLLGIDIAVIILSTILALEHGLYDANIVCIFAGCVGSCMLRGMLNDEN